MELVPMLVLLVSSVRLQVSVLLVKTLRARCAPVLVQCARNVMPLVLVLF